MLPHKFGQQIKKILAQNELLYKQGSKEALAYVNMLRRDVRDAIVGAQGFELVHLTKIRADLEAAGRKLKTSLEATTRMTQDRAWDLGSSALPKSFAVTGIDITLPSLSTNLLIANKNFTAGLIKDFSNAAIEDVSAVLRKGIITGVNPYKTMKEIEEKFFAGKDTGVYFRAESIVRTENNRMYNMANHLRLDQAKSVNAKILKTWVDSGDGRTRESHRQAGIDYAPGGHPGPIPIDQPYIVGGVELAYPNDPAGDAREVVNCRCSSVPYVERSSDLMEY